MTLDGTLRMTRHLPRPPAAVFDLITTPEALVQWWGPEGTRIGENDLDFSRIGPWFAVMIGPTGDAARVAGEVLRVDPPHQVELTLAFDMGDAGMGPTSTIRFALQADQGGTQLELTQTGLDPAHIDDMMNKGWNSALARLEDLVATH